jgi:hypothetical protein
MTTIHSGQTAPDALLRLALRLDAAASGAMGLAFAAAAPVLDGFLGIPTGWLVGLGAFLMVYALGLVWIAARPRIPAALAWTVILGNLAWVLASVAALVAGWFPLTAVGTAVTIAQAVAVAGFADLQYVGLRRTRPVPARRPSPARAG